VDKRILLTDLLHLVPSRLPQRWRDEFGADIAFAEVVFIDSRIQN
jgi:hypothetical protein